MIKAVVGNRGGEVGRRGAGGGSLCPQVGGFSLSEVNQKSGETLEIGEVAFSFR